MDGMLSQDEITALLNSMQADDTPPAPQADSAAEDTAPPGDELLQDVEKDAIGEVANISMGSSATTLYSLVNRKVNITTPVVTLANWSNLTDEYERPCVFIQIKYTRGLDGTNILVLKEQDVMIITDLMMGGDGSNTDGEIGELHLSAISEAMNQMMGSAATSLSTMLDTMIDISPPESTVLDITKYKSGEEVAPFLGGTFVKISFRMQIGDLVDSSIMQLYPIDFARKLVSNFMDTQMGNVAQQEAPQAVPQPQPAPQPQQAVQNPGMNPADMSNMNGMGMNPMMQDMSGMGMNPMMQGMNMQGMGMNPMMQGMNMQGMGMNPMMQGMNMQGMGMNPMMQGIPQQNVNIQPAQFQNFSNDVPNIPGRENIGLIMDVPLEVTVELGRTSKSISEILEFAPGTIIELDRIAGEPIDVLVNGKYVAKGEVVVIEESFGVRITDIIK